LFQACEEYLDKEPESEGMNDEEVFTDYLKFRQFEDRMYQDMHNHLGWDVSFISALCDEGYTISEWETLPIVQAGNWLRAYNLGGATQFYDIWSSWESIRIANISLNKLDMLEGNATQEQMDELKGQAHFMRAWYYFEFLRRQGGMPYITEPLDPSSNFALPRLSYYETAQNIAADCDTAAALLPERWDNANIGRPTKGAAMAVKATALLYAASPTNNENDDVARWEEAANASWDLIEFAQNTGRYQLMECNGTETLEYMTPNGVETIEYTSGFDSIFMYTQYNDEIIWENFPASPDWTTFTVPSLAGGGQLQGYSVSKNMVDMFETKDGYDIEDDPNYNPQDPNVNRDPRFYHSILFNRERWTTNSGLYLELWNGGRERTGEQYYNYTGYMARKYWPTYLNQWSNSSAPPMHVIYLRYADLLLQYAEAANEIGGPTHSVSGANMTAVEALNMVRNRVGMPDFPSGASQDEFREQIKQERAVELFLEGQRFFDLKRWHDSHKAQHREIWGVQIEPSDGTPTGYSYQRSSQPVITLSFQEKHYRFPIPTQDANMFEEFQQNPGW